MMFLSVLLRVVVILDYFLYGLLVVVVLLEPSTLCVHVRTITDQGDDTDD